MKYLNLSGLSYFTNKIKSAVADALDGKSDVGHTHTKSEITDLPSGLTVDTTLDGTSSNAIANSAVKNALDGKSDVGHTHTVSDVTDFPTLATVATSGSYNDLSNKPTIPTVNNATLTIQKNGTTVKTFTANASSNVTANITVPSKTSDLTNDSGFITGVTWNDVSNKPSFATVATSGSYNDLSNKPTIPTVNNATLTIQKNGTTIDTFTANSSTDKTVNITVPTKVSEVSNDLNYIRSLNNYMDFSWSTPVPNKVNIKVDQTWLGGILTTANTTIPTVYDTTLTIQKNGTTIDTFTANSSIDKTVNITVPTKTSDLTNDSGFLTSANALPIGSYIQFAGSQAPAGFLVCNGGAISRTTYSALFAVIGTTYGSGDGSTTFNLPNLTDRFLQGSTTSGTVKEAGLPNIMGGASFHGAGTGTNLQSTYVSFVGEGVRNSFYSGAQMSGNNSYDGFSFNASRSNSIYGNSTTVQPPALTCLICIKY